MRLAFIRRRSIPAGLAFLAVLVVLSHFRCSTESADPPPPQIQPVSADIGAAGGTLQITSADGVNYKLVVPENALAKTERLTITLGAADPVSSSLGALTTGVLLTPEDAVFDLPATLTVTFPSAWQPTQAPAILHQDAGAPAVLVESTLEGRALSAPLEHFSRVNPVNPTPSQMNVYWDSLILEIDTYGVSVARVRALVSIYLHALSHSAVYPSLDLLAWANELHAQTNDLIILGSLRCSAGSYAEGEYVLNSARNIASIMHFTDLEAEALEAIQNLCAPAGSCPNTSCLTPGYGDPELSLSVLGVSSETRMCGALTESYNAATESGNGIVGYGSDHHTARHDVPGQTHGGFSVSSQWDDRLVVSSPDPNLAGTWGYLTARIKVRLDGAAETRDGSQTEALSIVEILSGDLKLPNGDYFDIRSWNTEGGLHTGIPSGTYVFVVRFDFQFGVPRYLRVISRATATWIGSYGQTCDGSARAEAVSQWLGITGVYTSGGTAVTNYTVCSPSGTDYRYPAPQR